MQTEEKTRDEESIDIMELFDLIKGKISWILMFAMVGTVVAYAYSSFLITPLYSSTATVYVNNRKSTAYVDSVSQSALTVSALLVPTYEYIISTKTAMKRVIEEGGIEGYTVDQLLSMMSTSADEETGVFYITVTGADRYALADIANAIANYATLEIGKYIEGTDISVIEDAVTPEQASYPNTKKSTVLGFILGAAVSIGFILLMNFIDSGIRKAEDFAKILGSPVLGVIPDIDDNNKTGSSQNKSKIKEA